MSDTFDNDGDPTDPSETTGDHNDAPITLSDLEVLAEETAAYVKRQLDQLPITNAVLEKLILAVQANTHAINTAALNYDRLQSAPKTSQIVTDAAGRPVGMTHKIEVPK
jgi:hypothetical protein